MTPLPRILGTVVVVVACMVGLAGCRGGERAAPASVGPAAVAPAGSGRGAPVRTDTGTGTAGDPLAGIEAQVDAVERDVDADALPSR